MKKLFLFFFASLLSISMFAAGETGKTKAQAIPYNWNTGLHVSSEAGVGKWYVVKLKKQDGGPFKENGTTDEGLTNINVSVVNPLDEEADIDVIAYIGDNETHRHFKLAAGGIKSMTFGAGMFIKMGIDRVYLYLVMDVTITPEEAEQHEAVNVNVTPVESENTVVFNPIDFNWTGWPTQKTAGTVIPANTETWVKVDFDAHQVVNGSTYKFYVEKANDTPITIQAGVSYDCPATSIQQQSAELKSASTAKILDEAKLSMLPGVLYVRIKAPQELRIYAEEVALPAPTGPVLFEKKDAVEVKLYNGTSNTEYSLNNGQLVYKVGYNTLKAESNYYRQIEVTNNGSEGITIMGKATKTFIDGKAYSAVNKTVTIPAGQTYYKKIDKTMLSAVGSGEGDSIWAIGPAANVTFKLTQVPEDPDYCQPAQAEALTLTATGQVVKAQSAGTQWYKVDITEAMTAKTDITLTLESDQEVNITIDVAAECALGEPTQTYTGKSRSTTKTLSYSVIKDVKKATDDHYYVFVRVRTDKNIMVKAELLTAIIYNEEGAWSNTTGPTITDVARIEGNLTIANGQTIKALGITIDGGTITIKNGGKLIVGKEGIKGSQAVDQIVIEEGGNLMIDPEATTNNKPFVTAYKSLDLSEETNPNAVHAGSYKHEFIALPVENRENTPVGLYYSNWTYNVGWGPVDGFRHAFVGYDVTKSTANTYCGYFAGQLAPTKNQTLDMPGEGWHAFGNSWLVPLDVINTINNMGGSAEQAIHLYVKTPKSIAGVDYSINHGEATKQYVPVTAAIIEQEPTLAHVQPMEGFFLYTASATSATLHYNTLFDAYKAPKRVAGNTGNKVAAVLRGGQVSDFVYLIESEDANAHKMIGNGLAIYAEDGLAQIANENLIGSILTIQTNNATEYTLSFTWVKGEIMYLKDLVNGNIIAMTENTRYTFSAEPNTISERFQVIGRNEAPTAIENNAAIDGANKRIENGKIVIIKNGVKYDVLGTQL